MAIQHVDITDPNIHEPKGASTASVNTVYVMNGTGSGEYKKIGSAQLDMESLEDTLQADLNAGDLTVKGLFYVAGVIPDVSTAQSVLVPIIKDCVVRGASFVLGGAITTSNATLQVKNSAGATMGSDVTIPYSGSAKGNQFSFTATGNNSLTGPTYIEVTTDGASDTAQPVFFTIEYEYTVND